MQYADKITKSFLSQSSVSDVKDYLIDYQDPTFLGFQIQLVQPRNGSLQDIDFDDLPHGLFRANPKTDPYSCYNYLKRRGEHLRANYILEFEEGFKKIVNQCPWYFLSVSGLADAWKINPAESWRGKDKKLTIETLESIDLKMTYLMDLYRKAVFDASWMRHAVPDHMKWFKMDIIISEIRPMKIGQSTINQTTFRGYPISLGESPLRDIEKTKDNYFNDVDLTTINVQVNPNISSGTFETTQTDIQQKPIPVMADPSVSWSTGTFIKFSFEECEFDIFDNAPVYLDNVTAATSTAATNRIIIKTGVIKESNRYGLLGAVLEDTLLSSDYAKTTNKFAAPNNQSTVNNTLENKLVNNIDNDVTREYVKFVSNPKDTENVYSKQSQGAPEEIILEQTSKPLGSALKQEIRGAVEDFIKSKVNKLLLGNVYGFSPLNLIGSAQTILNNPAAAIQNILARHSSPKIGKEIAKKVEFTSDEMQLMKDLIGVADMQSAPLPDPISTKVNLQEAPSPVSNQSKVYLQEPLITKPTNLKVNLVETPSPVTNQSNVNLQEPLLQPSPAFKVKLTETTSPPTNKSKVNLSGHGINNTNDLKVNLEGNDISELGEKTVTFTQPPDAVIGDLKVNFSDPPKPVGTPEKTNLTSFAKAGSLPKKVEFEEPQRIKAKKQKVTLEEALVIKSRQRKVQLIEPKIEKTSQRKVELKEPPTDETNFLGKTNLT